MGGGWYSLNAGVAVQTDHTTPGAKWNDVTVANNTFDHVDRIAIAVTPDNPNDGTLKPTNIRILNNTIRYLGRRRHSDRQRQRRAD